MKVIHLISGGDTGGAKTHVHSLLNGLSRELEVALVCFRDGPFAEEARQLGIRTLVFPGRFFAALGEVEALIRSEGFELIHSHGSRGNLAGALLARRTRLPVVSTVAQRLEARLPRPPAGRDELRRPQRLGAPAD